MRESVIIKNLSIKSLRDIILDYKVTKFDTIILHPNDYDEIAVEYRETYQECMLQPYYLIETLITFGDTRISPGTIKISRNSNIRQVIQPEEELSPPFYEVYRCGWCGNVVAYNGALLSPSSRIEQIIVIEKFGSEIQHIKVHGACCHNSDRND